MKRKLIAIGIAVGVFFVLFFAAGLWVNSQFFVTGADGITYLPTDQASRDAMATASGSYFVPSMVVGVIAAALYYWLSSPNKSVAEPVEKKPADNDWKKDYPGGGVS
ncbi:MAG: hypothetical protein M3Z98_07020 [Candidatus Dormibacteraeota bacterium]|nr:hypothetical protein [Candidatus Dormibacteraeota bacterium]